MLDSGHIASALTYSVLTFVTALGTSSFGNLLFGMIGGIPGLILSTIISVGLQFILDNFIQNTLLPWLNGIFSW